MISSSIIKSHLGSFIHGRTFKETKIGISKAAEITGGRKHLATSTNCYDMELKPFYTLVYPTSMAMMTIRLGDT